MGPTKHVGSGKVRELFEIDDDRLLLVATDRISAFDVVLPQIIPNKGMVLTGLSAYWLEHFSDIPNHLISYKADQLPDVGMGDLRGRAMLVRKAEPLPIEFVVRGYLSGSGWREYVSTGRVCGHELPAGLKRSDKLEQPLLTPATKATSGHDENISEDHAAGIVGENVYRTARNYALDVYTRAAGLAAGRGVIIADTKFEFGLVDDEVILIDEVLTPDSSRFWPEDLYRPGQTQPSFDKQYVRDWLDSQSWDHNPPPPDLPPEVINATTQRYLEAYERVAGQPFKTFLDEVVA
ncbi:MAG: phosphoribosylaminoimidazolesuccinocarboxamide synthase [Actinomycetota bacterium]